MRRKEYQYEAKTVAGFVQQLAVSYFRNRYWFYSPGVIPEGRDPRSVDEKLLVKYEVELSKWSKYRRKKLGASKVQYLRFERTFLILATEGKHPFFEEERASIKDARESPVMFHGYSVGYKDGHPHVRIATGRFNALKAELLSVALMRTIDELEGLFRTLPFEPYGPVKQQCRKLLWKVNEARRAAGLKRVPVTCLRTKRRVVRPFEPPEGLGGREWAVLHEGMVPSPANLESAP